MSKKKFQEAGVERIRSELSGSLFFKDARASQLPSEEEVAEATALPLAQPAKPQATQQPKKPAVRPRHRDTTVSRHHDTATAAMGPAKLETIRQAVRQIGKEAATHRFTIQEKDALKEIEYTYGRKGIRTSENEITRIAVNHLIQDFHENGDSSILARVLEKLNQ
jgi:hypothetical protein